MIGRRLQPRTFPRASEPPAKMPVETSGPNSCKFYTWTRAIQMTSASSSTNIVRNFLLTGFAQLDNMTTMKQRYHTIIRPEPNGWFVGWVEEMPGTLTHGKSLEECRSNLREALQLMVETHRDEARLGMDDKCILEAIEIDVAEPPS